MMMPLIGVINELLPEIITLMLKCSIKSMYSLDVTNELLSEINTLIRLKLIDSGNTIIFFSLSAKNSITFFDYVCDVFFHIKSTI